MSKKKFLVGFIACAIVSIVSSPRGENKFTHRYIKLLILFFIVQFQTLFSQIVLQGTVTDNGAEYLGNGAEPVVNALVTVIDQADPSHSFSAHTNEQGQYYMQINPTGVDHSALVKHGDFRLLQNYPNPFNPSTTIVYELSQPSFITIKVYNVLGEKVKTLLEDFRNGSGEVVWYATDDEGKGVPAGLYFYSLELEGSRMVRKMTLVDGHRNHRSMNSSAVAASATRGQNGLNKRMADLYFLRITGETIELYEQGDMTISGNLVLDVSVSRTVTDIDGNVYRTVKIGDQWWMAENLRAIHYQNGDAIPNLTDRVQWENTSSGAWCAYGNNIANIDVYGRLYNWYAVNNSNNIAPAGWHVPTDEEWQILVDYLGGRNVAGEKMKVGNLWLLSSTRATNESGFSALPGGYRLSNGSFYTLGLYATFWSATDYDSIYAWHCKLFHDSSYVSRYYNNKENGYSVRCIRD